MCNIHNDTVKCTYCTMTLCSMYNYILHCVKWLTGERLREYSNCWCYCTSPTEMSHFTIRAEEAERQKELEEEQRAKEAQEAKKKAMKDQMEAERKKWVNLFNSVTRNGWQLPAGTVYMWHNSMCTCIITWWWISAAASVAELISFGIFPLCEGYSAGCSLKLMLIRCFESLAVEKNLLGLLVTTNTRLLINTHVIKFHMYIQVRTTVTEIILDCYPFLQRADSYEASCVTWSRF